MHILNHNLTDDELRALRNTWRRKLDYIGPRRRGSFGVYFIVEVGLARISAESKPYYIVRFQYENERGQLVGTPTYGRTESQNIHELKKIVDEANLKFNCRFGSRQRLEKKNATA